ncbi:TPA: nucleotidyltransferase domain-containing protein [Vibrio vulnificus]|uniref:nucleotidyltransferase domain-containing protein n=1 Tax=Vibrio vulnificus TaxID=672 RepID=UPI001FAEC5B3|nr:nucleotidyltransferase domain-containing protein [Vibrio vulnificus]MCJ0804678.1 nucleotidyltransferase domain-containing protein [Vibrio vulnificus]HDY7522404.1 nucleotidyltransferase domain-containing protein [Vibrio vulnificus]
MQEQDRGLDKQGFILNAYSPTHIQPEFKTVVDAVVVELLSQLPDQIDGIYLYGSIARGNAVAGHSDLDISIVLKTPISQTQRAIFQTISKATAKTYSQVSKLDIDPGYLNDILTLQEKYHWQFWLKHCCCCIWGSDLSVQFQPYKPSLEIALALNGDLPHFLQHMAPSFADMSEVNIAKVLGKKLVRAAYYFVAENDGSWYTDLSQCIRVAKEYYPHQSDDLELAYLFTLGNLTSKSDAFALYRRLSQAIMPCQ